MHAVIYIEDGASEKWEFDIKMASLPNLRTLPGSEKRTVVTAVARRKRQIKIKYNFARIDSYKW